MSQRQNEFCLDDLLYTNITYTKEPSLEDVSVVATPLIEQIEEFISDISKGLRGKSKQEKREEILSWFNELLEPLSKE